jgi:hypothetical protein
MSRHFAASLIFCLAIVGMVEAQNLPRPSPPTAPYEDEGACPFECCTYRTWKVKANTEIRTDRHDGAATAFRVRAGDQVDGVTGVVITTRFGSATIRTPITAESGTLQLQPGDTVHVLHYFGEGFWKVWVRGQFVQLRLESKGQTCFGYDGRSVPCTAQIIEEPRTVWWAKIRNRAGQEGWTRELDHFTDIDACA